jgi:hypothetical protein
LPTCYPPLPPATYVLAVIVNKLRELAEILKIEQNFKFTHQQ